MRRPSIKLNRAIIYLLAILLIISIVTAANDPGHDTLYIEESGDSELDGSFNITGNVSAEDIIFSGVALDLRGDDVETGSNNRIVGINGNGMSIQSVGSIYINTLSGTSGTVYLGDGADSVNINITGSLFFGADNELDIAAAGGAATASLYWGNKLLCNTSQSNCGWATTAGAGGDITAVNTNGDYLLGGADSGDVSLTVNETKLNDTIDSRNPAAAGGWTDLGDTVNLTDPNNNVSMKTLFVDNTNDRVGVGTNKTSLIVGGSFIVQRTTSSYAPNSDSTYQIQTLFTPESTGGAGLHMRAGDSSTYIVGLDNGSGQGDLAFITEYIDGSRAERMRLKYDGKLGIGTNAPSSILEINGTDPAITLSHNGTNQSIIKQSDAEGLAGTDLRIGVDESLRTVIIADQGDIDTDFGNSVNDHPRLYIYSADGASKAGLRYSGIYFVDTSYGVVRTQPKLVVSGSQGIDFMAYADNTEGDVYEFVSANEDEMTDTDAEQAWMYLGPKVNQSGTANYVGFLMNVNASGGTGSGNNLLMDLRVADVSMFNIDPSGNANASGLCLFGDVCISGWDEVNGSGADGNITGLGTANAIAKFTAAGVIGNSSISDDGNIVTFSTNITMPDSFFIGANAISNDSDTTAIGRFAWATDNDATAIGGGARATGGFATALGRYSNASAADSTALGSSSIASASYALAVGRIANATADSAIAIGRSAQAHNTSTIAIGYAAAAKGLNAVAIGVNAISPNVSSVSVGENADASGQRSVAIGDSPDATGERTIAIGDGARATDRYAIAMGRSANASGDLSSISIGYITDATDESAIAIGRSSQARNESTVAFGSIANATGQYAISIGYNTDATKGSAISIGAYSKATGSTSTAVGRSSLALGNSATALGVNANASAQGAVALGSSSHSIGTDAIAIGYDSESTATYSVAIGREANASGNYAIALGYRAQTSIANQLVIGSSTQNLNPLIYGNTNMTGYNISTVDCIVFDSGGKICSGS